MNVNIVVTITVLAYTNMVTLSDRHCVYLTELPGDEGEAVGTLLQVGSQVRAGRVVLGALSQQ